MADVPYVVCLSGPERTRARAEVALENAGVPFLPDSHHARMDWNSKLTPLASGEEPDEPHGFTTVVTTNVDEPVAATEDAGWVLRVHYHMPPMPPPSPADFFAEVERRLTTLEAFLPASRRPIGGGAVESPAAFNNAKTYAAEQMRRAVFGWLARTSAGNPGIVSGGLLGASDLQLSAPASGMSVNVSTGEAYIPGNEGGAQGAYYGRGTSQTNDTISAANPTNPRIDTICGTISDSGYTEPTGGSGDQWAIQVVTGTPTSGATLSNLLGAASLPGSSLLLGYVLVPANATNIIAADISNVAGLAVAGVPDYYQTPASGSVTAISGQWLQGQSSTTITLPAPVKNATVAITAASSVTSSAPITVQVGASGAINGLGLSGATSFKLGEPFAAVMLMADGANWWIVAGAQDTGWVTLSLGTNVSAATGYFSPAGRLIGDRVWLTGGVTTNASFSPGGTLVTLPSTLRPASTVQVNGPAGVATITNAAGAVGGGNSSSTYGLDGMSFRIS